MSGQDIKLSTSSSHAHELSWSEIDKYIQRGHELRSQAIRRTFGALLGRVVPSAPKISAEQPRERLLNAVTAIRSSLEVLRDAPDISEEDRARFVKSALHEEARLERMINEVFRTRAGAA